MPEFMGVNLIQGGAAAIVVVIVMLILSGRLVPRSTLRDLRADRDARLAEVTAERDTWRAAHAASEKARHRQQGQVGELLELSRTAEHLLRSLPIRPEQGVNARASLDRMDQLLPHSE